MMVIRRLLGLIRPAASRHRSRITRRVATVCLNYHNNKMIDREKLYAEGRTAGEIAAIEAACEAYQQRVENYHERRRQMDRDEQRELLRWERTHGG